jgi:hypothetical protein
LVAAARALVALGVPEGGTVSILGFNRPEWIVFDVAAMTSGAAPAVQALIDWAHEGPPAARVERVEVGEAPACDAQGFEQRETV